MFRTLASKIFILLLVVTGLLPAQQRIGGGGGSDSGSVLTCANYPKTSADLTTAAGTENEVLFELPARGKLTAVSIKHTTAFSGGSLTAMTVSVGDSSSDVFYTATFDIFQAPTDLLKLDTPMFDSSTFAARDVFAHFIATDDTMDNVSAGSVDLIVCWVALP